MDKQERRVASVLQAIAGLILFAFMASLSWPTPANAMAPNKSWEELQATENVVIRDHRTRSEPVAPLPLNHSVGPIFGIIPNTAVGFSANAAAIRPLNIPPRVTPLTYSDGGLPCNGVETRQQLVVALATCKTVTVSPNVEIDLSLVRDHRPDAPEAVLTIPDGVTLFGGRSTTVPGALLFMSSRLDQQINMLSIGSNTRISGFRLRGHNQSDTTDRKDPTVGIRTRPGSSGVTIDNNEIFGWPRAGVEVDHVSNTLDAVDRVRVTDNYIHNNVQCGLGYGVKMTAPGFVLVDRNTFDFNRHDVSGDGESASGYVATLNFILTSGPTCEGQLGVDYYNQHFDMHGHGPHYNGGSAGDTMVIRRNTIRGAQHYYFVQTRPAFELRGTPDQVAVFAENAVEHEDEGEAVRIKGADGDSLKRNGRLIVTDNQYGIDTTDELAVGDFDGDGRADVFQATGAVWVYSSAGSREWRFLNDSTVRLNRLAFGDFNGDGKTDVFTQSGNQWLVSDAGMGPWMPLPAGSNIPMQEYRFGDFDGDKRTDVFRANGSEFFISSGGTNPWKAVAVSRLQVGDLRFGDFDGDGRTDVFSLVKDQWSVSDGGVGNWRRLNAILSSSLDDLVFGDFNGDRRTDIALQTGDGWLVSWAGATPWQWLQKSSEPEARILTGDFDGDGHTDILKHRKVIVTRSRAFGRVSPGGVGPGSRAAEQFPIGTRQQTVDLTRYELLSGGTGPSLTWSQQDMW